ncbi:hypothetical protein CLTEP_28150 [Clostridium tepidiprofundi DSM 19306]|uniref:Uncharacterized protein n=1 Tax=Clostridium tepidiprofundi DSM 19306 TaxID=1121338 RepID=A0A151ABU6_9CLOT|nr:hypothetical protein [Clostridium tepidiprofundi]KYH25089.1 hypothetical protein CLTEP_28150 [Clostridium tepidiprofundi DSM 19306]
MVYKLIIHTGVENKIKSLTAENSEVKNLFIHTGEDDRTKHPVIGKQEYFVNYVLDSGKFRSEKYDKAGITC